MEKIWHVKQKVIYNKNKITSHKFSAPITKHKGVNNHNQHTQIRTSESKICEKTCTYEKKGEKTKMEKFQRNEHPTSSAHKKIFAHCEDSTPEIMDEKNLY